MGDRGFVIESLDVLGFTGGKKERKRKQSRGLLDNFIKMLFGFGCGFRKLRHFVQFGGILYKSLTKTSKNDEFIWIGYKKD